MDFHLVDQYLLLDLFSVLLLVELQIQILQLVEPYVPFQQLLDQLSLLPIENCLLIRDQIDVLEGAADLHDHIFF